MKATKNNKGFSLVELIVVVLIMGIIAVALAPQVMKWVGTSKENTDQNNAATFKSSVQTAIADYMANNATTVCPEVNNANFNGTAPGSFGNTSFLSCVNEVLNNQWPKTQAHANGFTVSVDSKGAVKVEYGTGSESYK